MTSFSDRINLQLITSLNDMTVLETGWNALFGRVSDASPFLSYAWMRCWYQHYASPDSIRLLVAYSGGELRAILPGVIGCSGRLGLRWSLFRCAADGQTPRNGILADSHDTVAVEALLTGIFQVCPHLSVAHLRDLPAGDLIANQIEQLGTDFSVLTEHHYQSYLYETGCDWQGYLADRSRNFRHRLNSSLNRASRNGGLTYQVFSGRQVSEQLPRLQILDRLTWQGKLRRGVFRREQDLAFWDDYSVAPGGDNLFLVFLQLDAQDAAFMTLVVGGSTIYQLRFGYHERFKDCRPGVLIRAYISEYFSHQGYSLFDMGATGSFEKEQWETRREEYRNVFLVCRRRFSGLLFSILFRLRRGMCSMSISRLFRSTS